MKLFWLFIQCVSIFLFFSCEKIPEVTIPVNGNSILVNTIPLGQTTKDNIEGIYQVLVGSDDFGGKVVLKWNQDYLSIFTGKNFAYMILKGGQKDSNIIFEGYWRFAQSSKTGLVSLSISRYYGTNDLINGMKPQKITFNGLYGNGVENPGSKLVLTFERPLNEKRPDFWIIAHRGGGRNIDRLPASENSIEMVQYAERLGANSIEIDIKLTKDSIPVLFHDDNLSLRLIKEDFFIGKVSEYTYAQLKTFCTLKNGGTIPTLSEILQTVIDKTNLKLVWLDIKSDGLIEKVAPIQMEYIKKAKEKGRKLEIIIGLPEEKVINELLNLNDFQNHPSLCELDESKVRKTNALIWAPRWSLGLLNDRINQMHSEGKRVFVWTVDEPNLVETFLTDSNFNGMVTNYSPLIAYEYYIHN